MTTTYEERKKVFENIKVLVKTEQEEVFRIIRKQKKIIRKTQMVYFLI